jgi:hypothetical protein
MVIDDSGWSTTAKDPTSPGYEVPNRGVPRLPTSLGGIGEWSTICTTARSRSLALKSRARRSRSNGPPNPQVPGNIKKCGRRPGANADVARVEDDHRLRHQVRSRKEKRPF